MAFLRGQGILWALDGFDLFIKFTALKSSGSHLYQLWMNTWFGLAKGYHCKVCTLPIMQSCLLLWILWKASVVGQWLQSDPESSPTSFTSRWSFWLASSDLVTSLRAAESCSSMSPTCGRGGTKLDVRSLPYFSLHCHVMTTRGSNGGSCLTVTSVTSHDRVPWTTDCSLHFITPLPTLAARIIWLATKLSR